MVRCVLALCGVLILVGCGQQVAVRERLQVLRGVPDDQTVEAFGRLLIGSWESAYRHPGISNLVRFEVGPHRAQAVVRDVQGREREVSGPYQISPENPVMPGRPTILTINIRTDSGVFRLRTVHVDYFSALLQEMGQVLLIDHEPKGVLRKLTAR